MATAESNFELLGDVLQVVVPLSALVSIWHFHFPQQLRVDVDNPLVIHEQRIPYSLLVMGYTCLHCECSDLRYLIDIGSCATRPCWRRSNSVPRLLIASSMGI